MIEDPLTNWPGRFPYRVLADIGITPDSTRADVEDVAFTLMADDRMDPATHHAWQQLRDLRSRLLADLLLYDVDQEPARQRIRAHIADESLTSVFDNLIEFDR